MKATAITARLSRGMILGIVVFVANFVLMNLRAGRFLELVRLANEGEDRLARFILFLFAFGDVGSAGGVGRGVQRSPGAA